MPRVIRTEAPNVVLVELSTNGDDDAYFAGVQTSRAHLMQYEDATVTKYRTLWAVHRARVQRAPNKLRLGIWALHENALDVSDEKLQEGSRPGRFAGTVNATTDASGGTEIGYWRTAEQVRKGCMTLSVRAVTEAFDNGQMNVYGRVMPGNLASAAVLTRAGFNYLDTIRDQDQNPQWWYVYDPTSAAEQPTTEQL